MHDKKPRKIHGVTEEELKDDLIKYRQMALDMGMTDAAIIPADKVHVSLRVRMHYPQMPCIWKQRSLPSEQV